MKLYRHLKENVSKYRNRSSRACVYIRVDRDLLMHASSRAVRCAKS